MSVSSTNPLVRVDEGVGVHWLLLHVVGDEAAWPRATSLSHVQLELADGFKSSIVRLGGFWAILTTRQAADVVRKIEESVNGAIQSFGQKFETLFLETSVESDGVTFSVSSVFVAGVIVEPRNKFYLEKTHIIATAVVAQLVKRPELRPLKEVQMNWSEFNFQSRHRR